MSTFGPHGEIDPGRGVIILCVGKKRSGKSVFGLLLFMSYPGDRLVLDVAGDDGPVGPDVITLTGTAGTLGRRLPAMMRDGGKPLMWRYAPDAGSPTFAEDMDHVIGMAQAHDRPICILVHEVGVLAPANRTKTHTRRLLMHNRHGQPTTVIFCGPRSQDIDPLVINQADVVEIFELQGVGDRKKIAECIGWNVNDFHTSVLALGPHEHLQYDANVDKPEAGQDDLRLVHLDALPADVVRRVERWAAGHRSK